MEHNSDPEENHTQDFEFRAAVNASSKRIVGKPEVTAKS